ncbi:protein RETICULATA-RELATED 1, chloroplastic-like [Bidens hawaiensis]|uniref:protein RETICULATA-RELATED 1, chloroplastic-like n=1 Tax=Bidens hawaiensis TaxID=980011 RepID=UPI004049E396
MALSPQGLIVMKLNDSSSRRTQLPKQLTLNSKPIFKYKVSIVLHNRVSPNPGRSLHVHKLKSSKSDSLDNLGNMAIVTSVFESNPDRKTDDNDSGDENDDDGNGNVPPPGNGGGGGGGDEEDHDEKEFGMLMKFDDVMKVAEANGVSLPDDMLEAAKATGLRELIVTRYMELQKSGWALSFLTKNFSMLRNRLLADPSFLFKVGTEIVIDSCCATFAEVQKRGKDFWNEFELYAADLLVGIVVDIAMVGMLAPYARIGKQTVASGGLFSGLKNSVLALPSSVFEFERPGCSFSAQQRLASYFYKGILYGAIGFGCGIVGQGIANMIMNAKRRMHSSEDDVKVPPLVQSAVLWGVFLAVSSNTRYQVVNGLESLVEASPLAKQVPVVAMAFTVGVRFANNIYGGMQFVDWARLSGVQ